jgi:hypothetical protein
MSNFNSVAQFAETEAWMLYTRIYVGDYAKFWFYECLLYTGCTLHDNSAIVFYRGHLIKHPML